MKQKEVRALVERGLHTEGFKRYANITADIINLYLNKSTDEVYDAILEGLRKGSFDDNLVRMEDTRLLKEIVSLSKVTPNNTFLEGEYYLLSDATDYRDAISFRVNVTSDYLANPAYTKVRIYDDERIDDLLNDSYHATSYDSPLARIIGDQIRVYTNDDFTIDGGSLLFMKQAVEFDVETNAEDEYPTSTRIVNAIIDRTIAEILKNRNVLQLQTAESR